MSVHANKTVSIADYLDDLRAMLMEPNRKTPTQDEVNGLLVMCINTVRNLSETNDAYADLMVLKDKQYDSLNIELQKAIATRDKQIATLLKAAKDSQKIAREALELGRSNV